MKLIRYGFSGPLVFFLLLAFAETGFAQNSGRQAPSLLPRKTSAPSPRAETGIDEESLQSFVRRFKRDVLEEQNQDQKETGENQSQPQYLNQGRAVVDPRFRSVGYPNPNANNGLRQVNPRGDTLRSVQDFDPSPAPPQDDNDRGNDRGNDQGNDPDQVPGFNPFSDNPNDIFNDNFEPKKDASVLDPEPVVPDMQNQDRLPKSREPQQRQPKQREPEQREPQTNSEKDSEAFPNTRWSPGQSESSVYQPQQIDYLPNYNFHPEPSSAQRTPGQNYSQPPLNGTPYAYGTDGSPVQTPYGYPPHSHAPQNSDPYGQTHLYQQPDSGAGIWQVQDGQYGNNPNVGSGADYFTGRQTKYSGIAGQEFLISENRCDNDCGFECELPIFYLSAFGYQTDLKNLVSGATTLHTNNGGGFGFALGQRQGDNLRMELEYSFRTNDINGATSLAGLRDLTGKVKSQAGMANVYWEMVNFPSSRFKPYFGAGLGFARLDSEIFDSLALPVTLGRMKDSSFAHQYIAGVNYKGLRNMDLFIEYRIFNADPFQVQNAGVDRYDYETTNLGGGLRWKF